MVSSEVSLAKSASGIRPREPEVAFEIEQVVDRILKAVLKGTKVATDAVHSIVCVSIARSIVASVADVTDRPDIEVPPEALMVGSLTSKSAAPLASNRPWFAAWFAAVVF